MTKKEYCENNPAIAFYSGFSGFEIHGIEYDINDYLYAVSGAWCSQKSYHRLKIHYMRSGNAFVILHGRRIPLSECLRMEV